MGRKRTPEKVKSKEKTVDKAKLTPPRSAPSDEGKTSLNFGGLPDRDIKKNLGCG
jgi:hypothetical protein